MSPHHDTLSLTGKTAYVTGSSRELGIGFATARALAANGANVALHYQSEGSKQRAEDAAVKLTKEYGVKTCVIFGRVDTYDAAKSQVEQILKAFGVAHIDILGTIDICSLLLSAYGMSNSQQSSCCWKYTTHECDL